MRGFRVLIAASCLFAALPAAHAQDRKPGLYDVTVATTMVSPSAVTYPARTRQVCLTQAMIDKYGAIVPDNLSNICQLTNVLKKTASMSAELVCAGPLTGKGTLDVSWSDSEHTKGSIHFSGTMQPGQAPIKLEWTATTTSVYKGSDCGELKPKPHPAPAPPPPAATP